MTDLRILAGLARFHAQPMGEPGMYAATVPGDFFVPQWDFMYFIEAIDKAGNGVMWPDLAKEMPCAIVKLDRNAA